MLVILSVAKDLLLINVSITPGNELGTES